jgi:5-methylthioadenosine/S-adenosylhomocysteine deaminase
LLAKEGVALTKSEPIVCYRNVDWLVRWNEGGGHHEYLCGGDFAYTGGRILHAGRAYPGPCTEQRPGAGLMIMPGLINLHTHSATMPALKGLREDMANPALYMSALYDGWNLFPTPPGRKRWSTAYAYGEMLRSGTTCVLDMCYPFPGWLEVAVQSGLRCYMGGLFQSALWSTSDGHSVDYRYADDNGDAAMKASIALVETARKEGGGLVDGAVTPMSVDTCARELLRDSQAEARRLGAPFQLHVGEAMIEFLEMTRRTGLTQLQWLEAEGLLMERMLVGHGIFLDHHSWLHWGTRKDVDLLAQARCAVTHCPVVFGRYGITLESFGQYRGAGVTMTIGTDVFPHNMIEEMRVAAVHGRIAAEHMHAVPTTHVFEAATSEAAKALGRNDLGRLAPGAKADFVVVDVTVPEMQPLYDPLRSLIYTAADRAVRDVFVDGVQRVGGGRVLSIDMQAMAMEVNATQKEFLPGASGRHWGKKMLEQIAPRTLPMAQE